jgi:hypothetical protein
MGNMFLPIPPKPGREGGGGIEKGDKLKEGNEKKKEERGKYEVTRVK